MYSVAAYGQMLADAARCEAYTAALDAAIEPGSTVLEIGSGPGVFAVTAARAGAGRVYAIEPDDAIHLGPPLAIKHGVGDRVTFVQTTSQDFDVPEPVDLVFSDLRGVLPLFRTHLPSIIDARDRLLKPGGVLMPAQDTLRAAVVETEASFERQAGIWHRTPVGVDVRDAWRLEQNRPSKVVLPADAPLTEAKTLAELDYRTITASNVESTVDWSVARAGTAHGVAVWFDTVLFEDIGFSCAPGDSGLIYGQMFFPLPKPVALRVEDHVTFQLDGHLAGGDYVWRWRTTVRTGPDEVEHFDQGSFWAVPLSLASLERRAAHHRPRLGTTGAMMAFVFERMDGSQSLEAIGAALFEAFGDEFESARDAFDQVCGWSVAYGAES